MRESNQHSFGLIDPASIRSRLANQRVMKRLFDFIVAFMGVVLLSPLLLMVAFLIMIYSKGPVLFRQERIGRGGCPFLIYKFRTMVADAPHKGGLITPDGDPRVTWVGHLLRKTKIDELPQLFNVLRGDMSLVGPRPEVRKYVELFCQDFEEILSVKPGITDLASLTYRDESAILGKSRDPEQEYIGHILPDKIRLAKEYIRKSSFFFDLNLMLKTLIRIAGFKVSV